MVFAAVLALAQVQSVTFKSEVMPLRTLIPELAKATGLPLAVSKDIEWETVFIRVKDVKPGDLMRKIAEVTFGAWEQTADGRHMLKFDQSAAARRRDEDRRELIKNVTESLKKQIANPKTSKADKTLAILAQSIGINALAQIPSQQRVVYSTAPTQMQRQLNGLSGQMISDLILEHNKGVDSRNIREGSQIEDEDTKKMEAALPPDLVKMGKDMEAAMRPKRIDQAPAKANFSVGHMYGGLNLALTLYDAKGTILTTFTTGADSLGYEEELEVPGQSGESGDGQEKKPEPDKTPVIKFSPDATEILALANYQYEGDPAVDYPAPGPASSEKTKKIRQRIVGIATTDPFLAAHTEVFDGYAKNVEGNIVFGTPDYLQVMNPKQTTVKELEEEILGVEKKEGWITASQDEPGQRVNRDVLAAAIAMIDKTKQLGLDQKAWLAANEDNLGGDNNYLARAALSVFEVDMYSWRNKPLLKIYGMMSPTQRQAARQGGLAVNSLGGEMRTIVNQVCFGATYQVKPYSAAEEGFDEEMFFLNMDFKSMFEKEMAAQKARMDYLMEPTESMPTGIPNGAVITIGSVTDKVYIPISKNPNNPMEFMGDFGGLTMEMLASMMTMGEMMGTPEIMGEMPKEVKPATRETLTFTLRCTDAVGYKEKHKDSKPAPDAKAIKIAELGPDFDKLLAKRRELMKQFKPMFEMGMGMGRRSSPPPTP